MPPVGDRLTPCLNLQRLTLVLPMGLHIFDWSPVDTDDRSLKVYYTKVGLHAHWVVTKLGVYRPPQATLTVCGLSSQASRRIFSSGRAVWDHRPAQRLSEYIVLKTTDVTYLNMQTREQFKLDKVIGAVHIQQLLLRFVLFDVSNSQTIQQQIVDTVMAARRAMVNGAEAPLEVAFDCLDGTTIELPLACIRDIARQEESLSGPPSRFYVRSRDEYEPEGDRFRDELPKTPKGKPRNVTHFVAFGPEQWPVLHDGHVVTGWRHYEVRRGETEHGSHPPSPITTSSCENRSASIVSHPCGTGDDRLSVHTMVVPSSWTFSASGSTTTGTKPQRWYIATTADEPMASATMACPTAATWRCRC